MSASTKTTAAAALLVVTLAVIAGAADPSAQEGPDAHAAAPQNQGVLSPEEMKAVIERNNNFARESAHGSEQRPGGGTQAGARIPGNAGEPQAHPDRARGIADRFRKGELSEGKARVLLRPCAIVAVEFEIENIDGDISRAEAGLRFLRQRDDGQDLGIKARIAALKKRLSLLRKARSDPDLLVERWIDLYLGKNPPERR